MGSDPHGRKRRKAAERTSVFVRTHHPSRGGAGPETSAVNPLRVRAQRRSPVRARSGKGSALQRSARTTRRCAARFEEGPRPSKDVRTFARVGRSGHASLFGGTSSLGSLARAIPERGRPKAKAVKSRPLSLPHTRNRCARGKCPCIARIAEVVGTSPCPGKRVTGSERVESLLSTKERVNGGSATSMHRA